MLLTFPESLLILRLSAKEGAIKFSTACKIHRQDLREIETGKNKLGHKRVNKILNHFSKKKLDFNWDNILTTFKVFNSISKDGFFGRENLLNFQKFSLEKRRENSILGLKSTPPSILEKEVLDMLSSKNILFEWQAPVLPLINSAKMIVADFAIPNSTNPKILIEATSGRMEYRQNSDILTPIGIKKLILGYRVKKFLPNTKLILFTTGRIDSVTKKLLLEIYDFVITNKNINKIPIIVQEVLDAN